jgi:hypothetical protein
MKRSCSYRIEITKDFLLLMEDKWVPFHHITACPTVVNGREPPDMEGSCEYTE